MKVFVSAPSEDLEDTRRAIVNALNLEDIVTFSMESLIASDNPPWDKLKKEIEKVDYLLLVVGEKYGTVDEKGIGYTEKEFDFAENHNIPILAFLKKFKGEESEVKLDTFRKKICDDKKRTVSFWNKKEDIITLVLRSIREKKKNEENNVNIINIKKEIRNVIDEKNINLSVIYPNYPTNPVGSGLIIIRRDNFSDIIISLKHEDIMKAFYEIDHNGGLHFTMKSNDKYICQISSASVEMSKVEYIYLEKAFVEYKKEYLLQLKQIINFLQIDEYKESDRKKFAYKIVEITYKFWKLLLEFSQKNDYLRGDGEWDMFSPNPSALNIIHSIPSRDFKYDGVMHAYFSVENTDEIGSEYLWLILNLEMTRDNSTDLRHYSQKKIWGCKTAYDWCIKELFPTVCSKYRIKKELCYREIYNTMKDSKRKEIQELQMFVFENGMQLSSEEIKCIEEALKYCLCTKILPVNEYHYIVSKLGLRGEVDVSTNVIAVSEEILSKLERKWNDNQENVDSDLLLRCINTFTDEYSKSPLSDMEVDNVYDFLHLLVERMNNIKFIKKYMNFYSRD